MIVSHYCFDVENLILGLFTNCIFFGEVFVQIGCQFFFVIVVYCFFK